MCGGCGWCMGALDLDLDLAASCEAASSEGRERRRERICNWNWNWNWQLRQKRPKVEKNWYTFIGDRECVVANCMNRLQTSPDKLYKTILFPLCFRSFFIFASYLFFFSFSLLSLSLLSLSQLAARTRAPASHIPPGLTSFPNGQVHAYISI